MENDTTSLDVKGAGSNIDNPLKAITYKKTIRGQGQTLINALKMDKKQKIIICEPTDDDELAENLGIHIDCAEAFFKGSRSA